MFKNFVHPVYDKMAYTNSEEESDQGLHCLPFNYVY